MSPGSDGSPRPGRIGSAGRGPAGHEPPVRAAGGVVWRPRGGRSGGQCEDPVDRTAVEVLVVHRPRYDDWTFPKGKLDAGESCEDAARREVEEETGVAVALGAELPPVRYVDRRGRDKVVRYWAMTPVAERPREPDDEVDDLRWVTAPEAAALLTYPRDRALLAALDRESPPVDPP